MFKWAADAARWLVLTFVWAMKSLGAVIVSGVLASVSGLFPSLNVSGVQTFLANANYFFPLQEVVGMASLAGVLWVAVWAYRVVKSWVPTVSGG